ncbi:MAG: Nucleotidyl transferase [Betaproteobacteria bacterium]|nr:Nucleotidyl transferase [Betaproteobacteria bacterium]
MSTWKSILVSRTSSIKDAVRIIDAGSLQLALVVDSTNQLLGTVSDGDVRRALLNGIPLDRSVESIMNRHPVTATLGDARESVMAAMKSKQVRRVPIVDPAGRVVGLENFDELVIPASRDNVVVLMAGGLGTRLMPLTEDCPKPMLKVGSRPILETILLNFIEFGFKRFYLSVNYKAEMITEYFSDGSAWGVDIRYLNETQALGTAGSLGLLPEKPSSTFVVMNADLLTRVNFSHLLEFHREHESAATMCVNEHVENVPYGVIKLDNYRIQSIEEKPSHRFFVNAGIYAFEPRVLEFVPRDTHLDMPALFQKLIAQRETPAAFPLHEYWTDIGRHEDLETAHGEFTSKFPN